MDNPLQAMTLRHVLEHMLDHADFPASSFVGGEALSFREFYEAAHELSDWLSEQGIGFGDKVAILAENSPHWGIAYFAVTSMGAVAVPILTEFHDEAVQHIITHSESKAVFVSGKLLPKISDSGFDLQPLLIDIDSFQRIEFGIGKDRMAELKGLGLREFRKLREKARRLVNVPRQEPGEDDLACIIYTSGTTGHSKGVMLTHKNLVYDALAVDGVIWVDTNDRFLSILPLAHTYECTLGLILPALRGSQVFYLDKAPTPRVLLPALGKVRPTAVLSVPLVIEKIFKSSVLPTLTGNGLMRRLYAFPFMRRFLHKIAGKKLKATFGGCLRCFCIGGAPLAPDVERFLKEGGVPYAIGFGLTETSPLIIAASPDKVEVGSCGFPLEGIELRLHEADPQSGVGEIMVRGPVVMLGYYKDQERSAQALAGDGWLYTGDLGEITGEGRVFIKGRSKNMILGPSGENIYPEEIESIILENPYILECLVYESDKKLIAKVHLDQAKIDTDFKNVSTERLIEGKKRFMEKLRNETNGRVSSFARLNKIVEQIEPFEKTATQKIKRYLYHS